jgi:hypothetical protein
MLLCAVFAASVLVVSGAAAATTPPTGTLTCGASGTMSLRPAIPATTVAPTAGWTMGKMHSASLTSCDSTQVTGGKAAITDGTAVANIRFGQLASCDTLMASLTNVSKVVLNVKLSSTTTVTTIDPTTGLPVTTSSTRTVAVVKSKDVQITQSGSGLLLTGTLPQSASGNKPFGGETIQAQINIGNPSDVSACTGGTTPLDHIDFGAGSSFSIHP